MAVAAAVVAAVGEVHIKPKESPDATVTSLREGEGQGRDHATHRQPALTRAADYLNPKSPTTSSSFQQFSSPPFPSSPQVATSTNLPPPFTATAWFSPRGSFAPLIRDKHLTELY